MVSDSSINYKDDIKKVNEEIFSYLDNNKQNTVVDNISKIKNNYILDQFDIIISNVCCASWLSNNANFYFH
jgi:hypothetical protein